MLKAIQFDSALRYHVNSRKKAKVTYLIELDAYNFNGICQCEDFVFNKEKHLRRGITPEQAVMQGLVKIEKDKKGEFKKPIEDALRCVHIIAADRQFSEDWKRIVKEAEDRKTDAAKNAARPGRLDEPDDPY
jgi:hypothetical protein